MQYVFGTGLLFTQPLGADSGATTPQQVGALRGVSVDMGFNAKDLHGGPWPLTIGRGTGKVSCSAEYAQLTAEGFNLLFFGAPSPTVGSTRVAVEEAHTVTGNAIAPVHAGTFELDLGIVAALPAGDLFHRVETAPGPRQYTCNESTGTYGVGGSDGQAVLVSYTYADATNGRRIDIANRNIGHTPRFSVVLTETFNGKKMTLTLSSCAASRLGFTSKMEDFTIPAFSFSAAADDAGIVGSLSVEEGANFSINFFYEPFPTLSVYSTEAGNRSLFSLSTSPWGNGLFVAAQDSGVIASIQRDMGATIALGTFSAKFMISALNEDDAAILVLERDDVFVLSLNPARDVTVDPLQRPRMSFGGSTLQLATACLSVDQWYRVDMTFGEANSPCVLTEQPSGNVVSTTVFPGANGVLVNQLSFVSDSEGLTCPTEYDDIAINYMPA